MTNQKKDLKSQIIQDLLATGFPLEVSASSVLSSEGWRVDSSPLYIDPETRETRELDLYGIKIYKQNDNSPEGILLFSHLIVQCKKSSKPWVFFDNATEDYFWLGYYSLKCDDMDFMSALCLKGDVIGFTGHRYKGIKKHRSFHTSFSEPNQASAIYEALITSCKALEYYKKMYREDKQAAHFLTPIVVLDGTLWSATLDRKSNIKIKQVSSLVVRFDYIFGPEKVSNKYTYQLVEIVTQLEFKNRIGKIESDNLALLNSWQNYKTSKHKK